MRKSYQQELEQLKKDMLAMASEVEDAIDKSVTALEEQDADLAREVIAGDDRIDELEIELEEKCTRLIALQQPVASDLRMIIVISKLATDLERIADHAVNISEKALEIGVEPFIKPLVDIPRMRELVVARLKESLDAFVRLDSQEARIIARQDEEIDELDRIILRDLLSLMVEKPEAVDQAPPLFLSAVFWSGLVITQPISVSGLFIWIAAGGKLFDGNFLLFFW